MPDNYNDKVLADAIRKAVEELNNALEYARKEGLQVNYDGICFQEIDPIEFNIYRKY